MKLSLLPDLKIPVRWNHHVHQWSEALLKRLGGTFEQRRLGECSIGFWRIRLRKTTGTTFPRRLMIVPGFSDSSLSWLPVFAPLLPVIARRHDEVILVDFPGFYGFLRDKKCIPSMDLMLQATQDLFEELQPSTLFGHSLGGWLTAHFAAVKGKQSRTGEKRSRYEGPETLIVGCPSGMFLDAEDRKLWRGIFERALKDGFTFFQTLMFHREPRWFRRLSAEFSELFSREDLVQFLASVEDRHELETLLPEIHCRTWILWGDKDVLCPAHWAELWEKRIGGNAQLVWIRNAGHAFQFEKPAVTSAVLGQVLLGRKPHEKGSRFWDLSTALRPAHSNESK